MFDVNNSEDLFFHIKRAISNYSSSHTKSIENLLFIIMGLNHLREWIAIDYDHREEASTLEQHFYQEIFELPDYKIINEICNGTKHCKPLKRASEVQYEVNIDDWPSIDNVQNFDNGPPIKFVVDGHDIETIFKNVAHFYEEKWFANT